MVGSPTMGEVPVRRASEWMTATTDSEKEAIVDDIAGTVDLGLRRIPTLMQEMHEYLHDDVDLIMAGKGMELVVAVLSRLQVQLGRGDVHLLVEYFSSRLQNQEQIHSYRAGVKQTAVVLLVLARMTNTFLSGDAPLIARAVFDGFANGTLNDQKPSTRLALFELIEYLYYEPPCNVAIVKQMSRGEFVHGLVSMGELEKDPKCLKILFQLYAQISGDWDDELHLDSMQSMHDSFMRYYPITLKDPPIKDPSLPTREELKEDLRRCMTSNGYYAKLVFPRLLELFETSSDLSADNKIDALTTLEHCVEHYEYPIVEKWSSKIWDALKFEVWNGENPLFIQGALTVIHELTMTSVERPEEFVRNIVQECSERIQDNGGLYLEPTGRILHAVGSSSVLIIGLIVKDFLPAVLVIWQTSEKTEEKKRVLLLINWILQARLDSYKETPNVISVSQAYEGGRLFTAFQERLIEVYYGAMTDKDGLEDESFRVTTIEGLERLVQSPSHLSDVEKGQIFETLSDIAVDSSQAQIVHEKAVTALSQLSAEDPDRFKDITLAKLLLKLPHAVSSDGDERKVDMEYAVFCLYALTQIACVKTCKREYSAGRPHLAVTSFRYRNFESMQDQLLRKLGTARQPLGVQPTSAGVLGHKGQLDFANAILATIYSGLELFEDALDQDDAQKESENALSRDTEAAEEHAEPGADELRHPYFELVQALYNCTAIRKLPNDQEAPYIGLRSFSNGENEKHIDTFVFLVGRIATLALRSQRTTVKNNFLLNQDESYPGDPSMVWALFLDDFPYDIDAWQPNLQSGPADKCLVNFLSVSLIAGLRREDKARLRIPLDKTAAIMMQNTLSVENEDCSPLARASMLYFMQVLINKFGAETEPLLQSIAQLVGNISSKSSVEVDHIYQTLSYFAAASLACMDKSVKLLVKLMIDGIKHPTHGRKVAQSFRILLAPSEVLIKENFCVIRPLRKGRLWTLTVSEIITMFRSNAGDQTVKENFLIALASVLGYMEPAMLQEHAEQIFPSMLEAMNIKDDNETKAVCIQVILGLIPVSSCQPVIESHLDSIIGRMTDRTRNTYDSPSDVNIPVRALALDVLSAIARHINPALLKSRKNKLMTELDFALDDCSREVRTRAGMCKMAWFNLADL